MNISEYVNKHGITCEIVRDRGAQVDDSGWEYHAYIVALRQNGREIIRTPWRQGYGVETSPSDTPDLILDSLVSDATDEAFEDWCAEYGENEDSRAAYALWERCCEVRDTLQAVFGADELNRLRYDVERL